VEQAVQPGIVGSHHAIGPVSEIAERTGLPEGWDVEWETGKVGRPKGVIR